MRQLRKTLVTPSESSIIRGILYHTDLEVLEVRLHHDSKVEMPYYYTDIPQYVYDNFTEADSYGKYYTKYIKDGSSDAAREYLDENELRQVEKDMQETLLKSPYKIASTIRQHDPELYNSYRETFELLANRQYDRHLMTVDGHDEFIQYTIRIIHELIDETLNILIYEYSEKPQFVKDCFEIAEDCLEEGRAYTAIQRV
jgi:hypothetical protein